MKRKKAKVKKSPRVKIDCVYDELVKVGSLVPNPENPNTHTTEQIELTAAIITATKWRYPIVVSKNSGMIVDGHMRYSAAMLISEKLKVPVDYQSFPSYDDERVEMIRKNRIESMSLLKKSKVGNIIVDVQTNDYDLSLTAISPEEIDVLLNVGGAKDRPEIEFTTEVMESNNYIVFVFDNEVDWMAAEQAFGVKKVKGLDCRKDYVREGLGRVLNGSKLLEKL